MALMELAKIGQSPARADRTAYLAAEGEPQDSKKQVRLRAPLTSWQTNNRPQRQQIKTRERRESAAKHRWSIVNQEESAQTQENEPERMELYEARDADFTSTYKQHFLGNPHRNHSYCHKPSAATTINHQANLIGRSTSCLALLLMLITSLAVSLPGVQSVDCFKCTSRNGSNPACEDPFHNLNTTRLTSPMQLEPLSDVTYHTPCYAEATGESLVVRHCALDSGTLTQDTELARMSHCGKFQFENDLLQGCVLACPEDACNSSPASLRNKSQSSAMLLLLVLMGPLLTWLASAR